MTRSTPRSSASASPRPLSLKHQRWLDECRPALLIEARYWFPRFWDIMEFEDLVHDGIEVILKKVLPTYDPTRPGAASLTTYCRYIIRREFSRAARERPLRALLYTSDQRAALGRRDFDDEEETEGYDPTDDYIAAIHAEFSIERLDALPPEDRRLAMAVLECLREQKRRRRGLGYALARKLGVTPHVVSAGLVALREKLRETRA